MKNKIPPALGSEQSFSRQEFGEEMSSAYQLKESQIRYDFQKKISQGSIIRVGRNRYAVAGGKVVYRYPYSEISKEIVHILEENFYDLDFRIFELIQLNHFVNHLFAHNTIIVSVENDYVSSVFDILLRKYPGKVMLKPGEDMYYRYLQDDEIVVIRLPSESPKGQDEPWHSRLEKILVDVLTDKLISKIVPDMEKKAIVEGAYHDYAIDENTMLRYARRKGALQKLSDALLEYKGETVI